MAFTNGGIDGERKKSVYTYEEFYIFCTFWVFLVQKGIEKTFKTISRHRIKFEGHSKIAVTAVIVLEQLTCYFRNIFKILVSLTVYRSVIGHNSQIALSAAKTMTILEQLTRYIADITSQIDTDRVQQSQEETTFFFFTELFLEKIPPTTKRKYISLPEIFNIEYMNGEML